MLYRGIEDCNASIIMSRNVIDKCSTGCNNASLPRFCGFNGNYKYAVPQFELCNIMPEDCNACIEIFNTGLSLSVTTNLILVTSWARGYVSTGHSFR